MDAGSFGDPYDNPENFPGELWEKTTFTWDMMSKLKYDVVTPGDLEMIQGLDAMKTMFAKHPKSRSCPPTSRTNPGSSFIPSTRS